MEKKQEVAIKELLSINAKVWGIKKNNLSTIKPLLVEANDILQRTPPRFQYYPDGSKERSHQTKILQARQLHTVIDKLDSDIFLVTNNHIELDLFVQGLSLTIIGIMLVFCDNGFRDLDNFDLPFLSVEETKLTDC
jgi:hypothetical protein